MNKISLWLTATRAYSLPISIMSWIVPFLFAIINNGNIKYGFIALFGIIMLHLGTNIFDDTIDYILEKNKINKGLKKDFNFQKGKCAPVLNGELSIRDYLKASCILFILAALTGCYFLNIWGLKLMYILIPSIILCILYPILGSLGFGEIIVATVFSPLLYSGTYFVMTGSFSYYILIISISTGLLSVAVLHNHMLLDYDYDTENRKITLCRLCKSKQNAYILLCIIIVLAYLNIILCSFFNILKPIYLISLLSLPTAITLLKVMKIHINNPEQEIKPNIFMGSLSGLKKADPSQQNFLLKFMIVRNLLSLFTILICISIILSEVFKTI